MNVNISARADGENGRITVERMWINQPSKLQHYHHLHGTNVLAKIELGSNIARVYFLEGKVISQSVVRSALSQGWKK